MAELLRLILPSLAGQATWQLHEHRSKTDLIRSLPNRLRGYASWIPRSWRIIIVVDRDDDDCEKLKNDLEAIAHGAGLTTKSRHRGTHFTVVNRLAIEELEAWYFGDWGAVCQAYPRVDPHVPSQAKYRSPDAIRGGTWEAFERLLQAAGYFKTGLRKIEAARAVAAHMTPARNTSPSFQSLRRAVSAMVAT